MKESTMGSGIKCLTKVQVDTIYYQRQVRHLTRAGQTVVVVRKFSGGLGEVVKISASQS